MKLVSGADIFWIRYVEVLVRGRLEKKGGDEEEDYLFLFFWKIETGVISFRATSDQNQCLTTHAHRNKRPNPV